MLLDAGIKTNIHYVLGNNSIDEAIERLKNNDFPKGINAVVFLLHKNVGLGTEQNVLKYEDPKVKEFFELVDNGKFDFQIGFDSCSIPGIVNFTKNIDKVSIDTCEGSRYSMYITSDMKALPCSFDNQDMRWAYDISSNSIQDAWNSAQFVDFRNHLKFSCKGCSDCEHCHGGCPIRREIVLCNREEKDQYESTLFPRN
jgi:radical SAM protein with 4Fe4S-binding SPASM domain